MGYKHYQAQGWPSHRACILLLCKGAHPLQCTLAPMRRPELSMHQPIMWQQPSIVQGQLPCRELVIVSLQSRAQPADQHAKPSLQTSRQTQSPRTLPGRTSLEPRAAGGCCSPPGNPPPRAPAAASLHGTPGCAAGHLAGQQDRHAQDMVLAAACPGLQQARRDVKHLFHAETGRHVGPERPHASI